MCILWAQLIIKGISFGPHPFVIPIRDKSSYHVLEGVVIGDCGPKNGVNCMDNGYIILENYQAPLQCLLGRLGSIDQ